MRDFSRYTLTQFCDAAKCVRVRRRTGKCRGPDEALSAKYWYEGFALRLPNVRPYTVGLILEPEGYHVKGEAGARKHVHRNKFSRYEAAVGTPNKTLVLKCDVICPGSAKEQFHPVWRLLSHHSSARALSETRDAFELETKRLMSQLDEWGSALGASMSMDSHQLADDLFYLTCLESIGAHAWLVKQAIFRCEPYLAMLWAERTYLALFVHGFTLEARKIARPFFDLVQETVLHGAILNGQRWNYDSLHYLPAVRALASGLMKSQMHDQTHDARVLHQWLKRDEINGMAGMFSPYLEPVGFADRVAANRALTSMDEESHVESDDL